ncbi:MAG: hypothetical protein KIS91_01165 [Anaerolineae bacterium]|nr:hypothetical protein [Anaerolineae bacterium]
MRSIWRVWLLVAVLTIGLAGCAGGVTDASPDVADAGSTLVPLSLAVEPTPWSAAPLPTAEAARVFTWPANGKPSLIFVYDDAAT